MTLLSRDYRIPRWRKFHPVAGPLRSPRFLLARAALFSNIPCARAQRCGRKGEEVTLEVVLREGSPRRVARAKGSGNATLPRGHSSSRYRHHAQAHLLASRNAKRLARGGLRFAKVTSPRETVVVASFFFCFRRGTTRHPRRLAPRSSNDPSGQPSPSSPPSGRLRRASSCRDRRTDRECRIRAPEEVAETRTGTARAASFVSRSFCAIRVETHTHAHARTHTHTCIEFLSLQHIQYCRGLSFSRLVRRINASARGRTVASLSVPGTSDGLFLVEPDVPSYGGFHVVRG